MFHPPILHILQERHKISLMIDWLPVMAGKHACQWSGGRQCWPCSSACQCSWTSIDYQWRLTALHLYECCHCLPPVDCKTTLKLLLTTLSSLALHCRNWSWPIHDLLQYAEYARKYARKYGEYDEKYGEYDEKYGEYDRKYAEQYAKYDKKYVQICSICNLVYCDILRYILHILHIAICPICPR